MSRGGRPLLLALLAIAIGLALTEAMLAVAARVSPAVEALLDPNAAMKIDDPLLGHRPSPRFADHDAWGFRNAAVPERADVVALGDSLTYGAMVPADAAWPQRLAALSGLTVYNMAFGGYGPAHEALLIEEALRLQPKLVILAMYSGNDLFDAFSLVYHAAQPHPDLSSDAAIRERVAELDREASVTARAGQGSGTSGSSLRDWLRESSGVYRLARALRNLLRGSTWQLEDPGWEQAAALGRLPGNVAFEAGDLRTVFTLDKRAAALDLEDVRIREGHRIALLNIARVDESTRAAGAKFAVLLLPTKEFAFAREVARAGGDPLPGFDALIENEQAMWRNTRRFLDEHGIPTIDALPALRVELAQGRQPFRVDDDGHLNAVGNAAVARLVQRRIEAAALLRN